MQSDSTNYIYLSGEMVSDYKYSHTVFGEGFYTFELSVERLSGKQDILPVTISERLLEYYHITKGDYFGLYGQVRSYNKKNPDNSNKLEITVFVKDVVLKSSIDKGQNPNDVKLSGYICKPPNYRMTPLGREITDILLAVNRSYHKSDYIPCIVWGRNAKFAGTLITGDKINVCGRLQSREYEKVLLSGESVTRIAYEVSLNNIEHVPKI